MLCALCLGSAARRVKTCGMHTSNASILIPSPHMTHRPPATRSFDTPQFGVQRGAAPRGGSVRPVLRARWIRTENGSLEMRWFTLTEGLS